MTSDLVKRLQAQVPAKTPISVARLMDEAADRIEQLEKELSSANETLQKCFGKDAVTDVQSLARTEYERGLEDAAQWHDDRAAACPVCSGALQHKAYAECIRALKSKSEKEGGSDT